ncbi:MAG: hypothetical protein K2P39_05540 [Lachnospiraceae bacterium]|nr:hypothetical protein [Lachnospiraceae bacterium]MDE7029034.1 hypothetical protein [Lachnospiraceae bacterium]
MDYTDGLQGGGLPLGLAFGMAMDEQAINNYGNLTEYEKEKILAESKNVKSKEEMRQLIQKISDGDSFL